MQIHRMPTTPVFAVYLTFCAIVFPCASYSQAAGVVDSNPLFMLFPLIWILIIGTLILLPVMLIRGRAKKKQTQQFRSAVNVAECPKCRQAIEVGKKFCPKCGASLVSETRTTTIDAE
jgi:uncharacterized paraquat-inducible protein A